MKLSRTQEVSSNIDSEVRPLAPDTLTELLNQGITIPQAAQVSAYLERHPDLVPNIVQASVLAHGAFPEEAKFG